MKTPSDYVNTIEYLWRDVPKSWHFVTSLNPDADDDVEVYDEAVDGTLSSISHLFNRTQSFVFAVEEDFNSRTNFRKEFVKFYDDLERVYSLAWEYWEQMMDVDVTWQEFEAKMENLIDEIGGWVDVLHDKYSDVHQLPLGI